MRVDRDEWSRRWRKSPHRIRLIECPFAPLFLFGEERGERNGFPFDGADGVAKNELSRLRQHHDLIACSDEFVCRECNAVGGRDVAGEYVANVARSEWRGAAGDSILYEGQAPT